MGSVTAVAVMFVVVGILAVRIKPELADKAPWSWFGASPFDNMYVCKQDVKMDFVCDGNNKANLPVNPDQNIIEKTGSNTYKSIEYRLDINMPNPGP